MDDSEIKIKKDGTMSSTALTLYVVMMIAAFVTVCVSGGFSIAAVSDAQDAYDFVNNSCCRTGYEIPSSFSPSGSCEQPKKDVLDTFIGDGKYHSINLLSLEVAAKVFVWILWAIITVAFIAWIVFTVKLRMLVNDITVYGKYNADTDDKNFKSLYTQRRILFVWTLVLSVAVGLIAITLTGISYSFVSFQRWDLDFVVAGCCCCFNHGTSQCDSGPNCNSDQGTGCFTNKQLKEHLGEGKASIADTLMPAPVEYNDWAYKAQSTLITVFLSLCFFIGTQLIAWYISKPTNSKVKLPKKNADGTTTTIKIDIDRPELRDRPFMYRAMRGGAQMQMEEEQQHLRKRASKQLSF